MSIKNAYELYETGSILHKCNDKEQDFKGPSL
ncbi:hypothetical protein Niako_3873 [Niastella koreensis GR20-10]|uniref:Uncharacterized protein n=1 Tax=Niastella koreensis (strain DSM 17620 / KACC 11465 / NBRC 106392 / GR20-10) TaxID=700598 RepID=G8T8I9_NIAKG|nr:hypothetical protein Niako_3873 [Niastella koreensis GR20-10]